VAGVAGDVSLFGGSTWFHDDAAGACPSGGTWLPVTSAAHPLADSFVTIGLPFEGCRTRQCWRRRSSTIRCARLSGNERRLGQWEPAGFSGLCNRRHVARRLATAFGDHARAFQHCGTSDRRRRTEVRWVRGRIQHRFGTTTGGDLRSSDVRVRAGACGVVRVLGMHPARRSPTTTNRGVRCPIRRMWPAAVSNVNSIPEFAA